jgi:hypothetical protein
LHVSVEVAGEVALDAAGDFAVGFAFGSSAVGVVDGGGVGSAAGGGGYGRKCWGWATLDLLPSAFGSDGIFERRHQGVFDSLGYSLTVLGWMVRGCEDCVRDRARATAHRALTRAPFGSRCSLSDSAETSLFVHIRARPH